MFALLHQWAGRLHSVFHNAADADPFSVQQNPAGGNAGNFQQVIHQVLQLPHLTVNDRAGLSLDRVLAPLLES